jgi:hypothetical protein
MHGSCCSECSSCKTCASCSAQSTSCSSFVAAAASAVLPTQLYPMSCVPADAAPEPTQAVHFSSADLQLCHTGC